MPSNPPPALVLLQSDPSLWDLPPLGKTYIGLNLAGQVTIKQHDGTVTVLQNSAPGGGNLGNSGGTTTITPASAITSYVLAITAGARTVPIVLDIAGQSEGNILEILISQPGAGFLVQLRNATGSGTVLDSYTSDGFSATAYWRAKFTGGAWVLLFGKAPAY